MAMTPEQQRAIALANARLRLQEQESKQEPSLLAGVGEYVGKSLLGGPLGMVGNKITSAVVNEFNKAAYDAGGLVTDAAAKVLPPEAAAGVGLAANVGVQAIPMLAGGAVGAKVAPALESTAQRLMQSAIKPSSQDLIRGKAARAIDTMLKEGINATPGGMAKLRSKVSALNKEVFEVIKASPGSTVDKNKVASELQDLIQRFSKQVNPKSDVAAIESAWAEFLAHPLMAGQRQIPVALAQDMKQATYRALGDKAYGELQGASREAQKTLARGLRSGIEEAAPQVAPLNAEMSKLMNALNVAERRAIVSLNNNPAGLAFLGSHPTAAMAFIADRSAAFKSLLARMIYAGKERIPETAGQITGAALGATTGRQ